MIGHEILSRMLKDKWSLIESAQKQGRELQKERPKKKLKKQGPLSFDMSIPDELTIPEEIYIPDIRMDETLQEWEEDDY